MPAAGCGWVPRLSCRGASPWAAAAELRWTEYEGNWFPFTTSGEPREDRTRSLRVSVHNRVFAWKGFSPQLSLVHEVRTTNAQLYDYKRTGGELRFVRLF